MEQDRVSKEITPKSKDYSQWYLDVVLKADMADYGPVGLHDHQALRLRRVGEHAARHGPAHQGDRPRQRLLPAPHPQELPRAGEGARRGLLARVRLGDDRRREELEEPLAMRPTSEAIICSTYAKWVQSWRDLPILINQWANVVRWEKVTRPFLRTTEFLWQEGHTLHATEAEAEEETLKMLDVYRAFSEEMLAMPVLNGRKTDSEKFAGALRTYAIEALMGDGKALQAGTSHNLGQHFSTAYGIEFLDKNQQRAEALVHLLGHLDAHDRRDDHDPRRRLGADPAAARGALPGGDRADPAAEGRLNEAVLPKAREVQAMLRGAGVRVHLDDRDQFQPGYKYADWEMRGVPLRLELGPKDIEKDQCVLVRRDNRAKEFVPLAGLGARGSRACWTRSRRTCWSARGGSWRTTPRGSRATTSSSR